MRVAPGLAGFLMSRDRAAKEDEADLRQQQVAMTLGETLRKNQEAAAFKTLLAQSGGDAEKAVEIALKSGNTAAAAQLAPLAKMKAETRERESTAAAVRALYSPTPAAPQNPMIPGHPGSSIMAGSGESTPTAPRVDPNAARLDHLNKLAIAHANDPTALNMIEREKGRILEQSQKAPVTRPRFDGKTVIQEERQPDGSWVKIGEGPRFPEPSAINVYSGSLTAGVDPNTGEQVYAQPSQREGVQPRIVTNIKPTPKPPAGGSNAFGNRAIPTPLQKQLTEGAEIADATDRFVSSFKDEYGGYVLEGVGNAVNWVKRKFGDDSGQAQWWQDYELHQSKVRNSLFGSALTKYEIGQWSKAAIEPGMDPAEIRKNLQLRQKLETTGLERLMAGTAAGGYIKEQIEAFTGRKLKENSGGPKKITNDAEYNALPSGAEFIGPDGKKRRKP
jgi:hypothetical protein